MPQYSRSSADVEAYRLMCAGRFEEALVLAEQAVAGQRTCVPAHGMLATILLQLGRSADADEVVLHALQCEQGVADAYDGLAHVSLRLGKHDRSNALYRRVVELSPDSARFWYNLASSERSFGRLSEADAACERAIALDPGFYAAYLLRSELRVQSPESNHIEELESQLARSDHRGRVLLGYAIGKELDDLQRYDEAFRWFSMAASTRRQHLDYNVSVDEQKIKRIMEVFSQRHMSCVDEHEDSAKFIFIVGLPRSGTTLLERILTGLPGVHSNGETDNFMRALMAACPNERPSTSDVFERAARADSATVASHYAKLAIAASARDRIVEKLPLNYLYLGAIHRALPQAKLILVSRSPLDSCFAMYRILFGEAYPFSYDFEDLARYYSAYDRLIDHWRTVLGSHLHEVTYEDLVSDPIRVGKTVAHACDVPWNDSAIEVHKNASVSLTASASQVRRPIYTSSRGRWRHYRAHLQPLVQALRTHNVSLADAL